MTLLDPPAAKPEKSRALAFTISALALVFVVALYFAFRYYPEKQATAHFLDALAAGNTDRAYQLWKPSSGYSMKDFLADWGPQGYYGPVKRACSSSGGVTLAVPSLPTTTPAATLASIAASTSAAPETAASASTLSTVSPAPVTSKTCRPVAPGSIPGCPRRA